MKLIGKQNKPNARDAIHQQRQSSHSEIRRNFDKAVCDSKGSSLKSQTIFARIDRNMNVNNEETTKTQKAT